MKKAEYIILFVFVSLLIACTAYLMIRDVDVRLQARERSTDTTECTTVFVGEETDEETVCETVCETTMETVYESCQETEQDLLPVAESANETIGYGYVVTDDLMLLARLIESEAGCEICTDEHQRAVASVLLNHVASPSPDFPDTVFGCIFSGWIDNGIKHYGIGSVAEFMAIIPSDRAIANAAYVMQYGSTVGDAIYQAEFIPTGGEIVAVFEYPGTGLATTYICR